MDSQVLIVAVGRNCAALAERCLRTVASLDDPGIRVAVVDDASTDGTRDVVDDYTTRHGWTAILRDDQRYALENQVAAWTALEPRDDDVIVFVDLDDALPHPFVTHRVREEYERGAWMTYGSYEPWPPDHPSAKTCRPASAYPEKIVMFNRYRYWYKLFNHLRTVSWRVLKHLTVTDLTDDRGRPWRANTDASVMIPCLELSGRRAVFIPDVLYQYTCDSDDAVWRTMNPLLAEEHRALSAREPKRRLP